MLRSMNNLEDYVIHATDGNIGHVKNLYFDDKTWVVRYLVVETGNWLSNRKVLISPIAIGRPNWIARELPVPLTMEQVKNSPDIDTEKPVSRQYEIAYQGYYGYPFYWTGTGLWGDEISPWLMIPNNGLGPALPSALEEVSQRRDPDHTDTAEQHHADPHLRSCREMIGYRIEATDGEVGHVADMLVDEETWAIQHLVVNAGSWWLGRQVLIAPRSIKEVSWTDTTVSIVLTRQDVKEAPAYDWTVAINSKREAHDNGESLSD